MKARLIRPNTSPRLLILARLIALSVMAASCLGRTASQPETITLGLPRLEQNALVYIAEQQGLFAQNNLKVEVKDYDTGVTALKALLKGEVDLAEAAEFPFVGAALRSEPVYIIAVNDKFENNYVVARLDRGIEKPADLKGKRIGLARQAIAEFFLGRLLDLEGIRLEEVTLVDVRPAQYVNAIASGEVDALIAWQPYTHQIQQQVSGVVVLPAQSDQSVYGVLIGAQDWLKQHPDRVVRFLKSLKQAESFLVLHPEQARVIVQQRLNYEADYLDGVWAKHRFSLSLDYSLVVAMTDEARWMIRNKLTAAQQAPYFVDCIYLDGLKAVKPEAVNIAR